MKLRGLHRTVISAAALVGAVTVAQQGYAGYYQDKTVTIVVGFGAGGGADTFGRLLGRHLGANIPDKPSVIVQNMPGAGGFKAVNYVYNLAPKDGTYIILTASAHATAPSLGNKAAHWNMLKLQWLGNLTPALRPAVPASSRFWTARRARLSLAPAASPPPRRFSHECSPIWWG